jgi:hypothetical protein
MNPCIETASGKFFDFIDPDPDTVCIDDIAHALSNICRFTGHTRNFYSVAQHSVYASCIAPPALALAALMHDAPEAYIGDVSSPLKGLLSEYRNIERRVAHVVLGKFGLDPEMTAEVRRVDIVMLNTERLQSLNQHDAEPWRWLSGTETWGLGKIRTWNPLEAKELFLNHFFYLGGKT